MKITVATSFAMISNDLIVQQVLTVVKATICWAGLGTLQLENATSGRAWCGRRPSAEIEMTLHSFPRWIPPSPLPSKPAMRSRLSILPKLVHS